MEYSVACIKEASTVRAGKVWGPTLRGGGKQLGGFSICKYRGGWGGRCTPGIMSHITHTPLAKSGVGGVTPANGKNLLALLVD